MKIFKLFAILIVIVLIFSACQKKVMIENAENNITVVEETQSTYIPKVGGELDICIPEGEESFNPLSAVNEDFINFLGLIYESPLNIEEDGHFEPCLAETWEVNEEGDEYTFIFRKGITFHNGNSFSADDVLYTINKIFELNNKIMPTPDSVPDITDITELSEPDLTIPSVEELQIMDNTVQNTTDDTEYLNRFSRYLNLISNINKEDDYTIKIKMNRPGRECLYFMTFAVLDSDTSFNEMNGTGPYCYSERGENNEIILNINESWWKTSPYIEKIVAKRTNSQSDKINKYNNNEINFYTTNSIASAKQKEEGVTQLIDYNTNYYDCIVPNLFNEKMKNDNIRKAISYAINRRDIISSVLLNHAIVTEVPINPKEFIYNVKYKLYEYDETTSRELLEQEGYATDTKTDAPKLEITLIVPIEIGYEYRPEVARVIADQLSDVGIICNVEELSPDEYLTKLYDKNFDLAYCSYYLDRNPDISFMLGTGESGNYGNIASTELDAILSECQRAVSEEQLIGAYDKLQQYFVDKVPQIGLFYRMFSIISDEKIMDISDIFENTIFKNINRWSIRTDN